MFMSRLRKKSTSAMLLSSPRTLVSMDSSPGKTLSTSRYSSSPPSLRKTEQVSGLSSVRFQSADSVNLRVTSTVRSSILRLTSFSSFCMLELEPSWEVSCVVILEATRKKNK